jgi:GNAT superfamily N-acetyltransferase
MTVDWAGTAELVDPLTALINEVYAVAELGLWREGAMRTTATEMAELIPAGQIAVATRHGKLVGSIRLHDVAPGTSEFGMLVAAPDQRGKGVGRVLLDFAERHSRERGLRTMRLELLVPRLWTHPTKEFLKAWYGRRGYRRVRTVDMSGAYPHLAPLLATPCDLEIHEKPLILDG